MLFASSLCITILLSGKTYAFVDLECYIYLYTFLDNKQYNTIGKKNGKSRPKCSFHRL